MAISKTLLPLFAVALLACGQAGGDTSPGAAASGWQGVISVPDEPGERLLFSGTVYEPDGKTPAPGVDLLIYHTDVQGLYRHEGTHGGDNPDTSRLWARLRTDARGRYELRTITPGPYPNQRIPAHIHLEAEKEGYRKLVLEVVFEGDPYVTAAYRRDDVGIRPLEKGPDGTLRCVYDFKLAR
jgi:protocatechuate 3,4-dioxygenase, beta subunit